MGPSPPIMNIVSEFRRTLERQFGTIDHVIVFGSQARGDAHADSDVDVIVVSPAFRGMNSLLRSAEARRSWTRHVPVDILCYTPEEFADLSQRFSLVSEALREGTDVEA